MDLETSKVDYSWKDIIKKVTLPACLTPELAEDIGLMLGDGCINIYKYKHQTYYYANISGKFNLEKKFYDTYIVPLKNRLFNITPKCYCKGLNEYGFQITSKAVVNFYLDVVGLPKGSKNNAQIPKCILDNSDNQEIIFPFIRGLFDTDGYIALKTKGYKKSYPVISISQRSKKIIEQLYEILKNYNFSPYLYHAVRFDKRTLKNYTLHTIYLSGHRNKLLWNSLIGSNNYHKKERLMGPE